MKDKKVLFIDDDTLILEGYRRLFGSVFSVEVEANALYALEKVKKHPEHYSVIVVDMQMPLMNGLQFIKELKELHPDITRLMVTGIADKIMAIDAVNQGEIFRFYEKPCSDDLLRSGIEAGINHHNLLISEKELLNQTLQGIVALLIELLSKAHPVLFERAKKVVEMVKILTSRGVIFNEWELKIAALLYNIGYFAIPEDVLGENDEFKKRAINDVPGISAKLINKIKRFSNISKILHGIHSMNDENYNEDTRLISILYQIVVNAEKGIPMYKTLEDVVHQLDLSVTKKVRDQKLITAIREFIVLPAIDDDDTVNVNVYTLKEGDVIASDIIGTNDKIIMEKGKTVTRMVIEMLIVFYEDNIIPRNILVKR